jgi:alpha-mannosidase
MRPSNLRLALRAGVCCLLFAHQAGAQPASQPVSLPVTWLQGYARRVAGEVIGYPWAYPGQTHTLLSRAVDGKWVIEWEGEPVGPGRDGETVTYVWHAGLASGYGAHRFSFSVNGSACTDFRSGRDTNDREWVREGADGCTLAFQTLRVGTFNELFGLMVLTVPRRLIGPGPPRFSVVGEPAGSQDYCLVFEERVESWIRAKAEQARFKDGRRAVRLEVSRIGTPAALSVTSHGATVYDGRVAPGYNVVTMAVDGAASELPIEVRLDDGVAARRTVALPPVRPWEIHLLPHSHVDIGYSDPQPEVERKQWTNLRDAVALADSTAGYPADARFRWNVEGLWSVESYLAQASPDERRRFVDAVNRGSIGLQANYTNVLTGLATPEELHRWTDAARRLAATYGLPVGRSAMHTDIPGLAWTVVSSLAHGGVRYFSSGPNYMPSLPDGGDRIGDTLHELGDRPFWWVSPSGRERLLFWMAGRGYSLFHGLNAGAIETGGRPTLLDYLLDLEGRGYPYDLVQVRYTVGGDNGPTDPGLPDFVRTWNETYDAPRLVIDTTEALFAAFEKKYGSTLPERRGDMTPYWEDGAASTAAEEALTRAAARRLQQAETLWAITSPATFPSDAFSRAWRSVLLWHEHTWGAADSINQPDRPDVVEQWRFKRAFAVEADRQSHTLLAAAPAVSDGTIDVVNTTSTPRGGLVVLPAAANGRDRVVDQAGRVLPSQRATDGRLLVQVPGVAPFSSARISTRDGASAAPARPVVATGTTLDNGIVRVTVDPITGDISSLTASAVPGIEFVTAGGLGRYLYVPGRDPAKAAGAAASSVRVTEAGPLLAEVESASRTVPGAVSLVRRVSLAAGADAVDVDVVLDKTPVREKESAHLAFPLNVPGGVVRADLGEAIVAMDGDQLPGSCRDFIGVTSAVDLSNDRAGVTLASADAPLVEPGALTDERSVNGGPRAWRRQAAPGPLYVYLLNNYWHTNYKADQSGRLEFRFQVRPHGRFDPVALRRSGEALEQPLLARPTSAGSPRPSLPFAIVGDGILVSSLRPTDDGRAFTVRLYNPTPREVSARVSWSGPAWRVAADDGSGGERSLSAGSIPVAALGTLVIRVSRGAGDERVSRDAGAQSR